MALQIAAGAVGSTLCIFTTVLLCGFHCWDLTFPPTDLRDNPGDGCQSTHLADGETELQKGEGLSRPQAEGMVSGGRALEADSGAPT